MYEAKVFRRLGPKESTNGNQAEGPLGRARDLQQDPALLE